MNRGQQGSYVQVSVLYVGGRGRVGEGGGRFMIGIVTNKEHSVQIEGSKVVMHQSVLSLCKESWA